jgi:hypothetical protein
VFDIYVSIITSKIQTKKRQGCVGIQRLRKKKKTCNQIVKNTRGGAEKAVRIPLFILDRLSRYAKSVAQWA